MEEFKEMLEEVKEDLPKIFVSGLLKLLCIIGFSCGVYHVGKTSYEKSFSDIDDVLKESRTIKKYNTNFEEVSSVTKENKNTISEQIFNATNIDVEENNLFEKTNNELENIETLKELKTFAYDYLKEYIASGSRGIDATDIDLYSKNNTYGVMLNGEILDLDHDSLLVISKMIESIDNNSKNNKELMDLLYKQIFISELYDVEEINDKVLSLTPIEKEF